MRLESASELKRWQDWQARFAAADRRTAVRVRILATVVGSALVVWLTLGLLAS